MAAKAKQWTDEPDPAFIPQPWWEAALDTLWFPFALLYVGWPFLLASLRPTAWRESLAGWDAMMERCG